jgi:regulator of sirC expression with transglutaminase-like and TPR domain
MTISEFHAMTKLLDDPDNLVYDHIEKKMVDFGQDVVPLLENVWRNSKDLLVQSRIEEIIERINFNKILDEFSLWKSLENPDLIDAMAILNQLQYPNYDAVNLYSQLEEKSKEIWLELNEDLTALELVNVLNKIIYEMWGFRSVNDNDSDAFHYHFLSNLLELKCGNQFSISLFYLFIAEKMDLLMMPVLLENQLVIAYLREYKQLKEVSEEDILFYINPNEKGLVFDELSIRKWITKHELEEKPSYFLPTDNKQVIKVYIDRLISGYTEKGSLKNVKFLEILRSSIT